MLLGIRVFKITFNKKQSFYFAATVVLAGIIIILIKSFSNKKATNYLVHEDRQLSQFTSIYSKAAKTSWKSLKPSVTLQLDVENEAVILLRNKLQHLGDLTEHSVSDSKRFDQSLKEAVIKFQDRHGIHPSGIVDQATLSALNVSPQQRLVQLHSNIQRWSDFNKHQSNSYVWINLPDYKIHFVDHGQITLTERVIIGKLATPTPTMNSEITQVMFNPYWVIPQSIAEKTIIPMSQKDPSYLINKKIALYNKSNHQEINPQQAATLLLDNSRNYFFRQQPGKDNPLGQIKFKITNSDAIYLHDTSSKELFKQNTRALSAGCVRIENPLNLFSQLADFDKSLQQANLTLSRILQSNESHTLNLSKPIPVYITYFTAWVDESNKLHFAHDIYNQDHA